MADPRRVAILISGRGSNMRALVDGAKAYRVVLVASNKPHAEGLDWARMQDLPTWTWNSQGVAKTEYDEVLSQALRDHDVGTIALAGFMRILSPKFVAAWRGRIVNIHPSLLPKYRGLDTHRRAIEAGDTVAGCSVHLVTEELDAGDVLGQSEVAIAPGDDATSLQKRVLAAEHRLYPDVLNRFVTS
jgi:phosphoribosylglycinamide formyltransferase-1